MVFCIKNSSRLYMYTVHHFSPFPYFQSKLVGTARVALSLNAIPNWKAKNMSSIWMRIPYYISIPPSSEIWINMFCFVLLQWQSLHRTMSNTSSAPPPGKRKEIYKYEAPWTVYSMNWSIRSDKKFRLALGSFVEEYNNKVSDVTTC